MRNPYGTSGASIHGATEANASAHLSSRLDLEAAGLPLNKSCPIPSQFVDIVF